MCGLFLRLVPYVGEVSPRSEAATKTGTRALQAQSPTSSKRRPVREQSTATQANENRLGRPPQWNNCTNNPQPLSGRAGGKSGKRALGLSHALSPKWHRKGLSHSSSRRESKEFHSGQVHASSIQHACSTRCVITCGDFHTESSGAYDPAHPPKRAHWFDESVKRDRHKEGMTRHVR